MKNNIRVIGFDADDTLWVNEPYFQETELKFCELLSRYLPPKDISAQLLVTEIKNLPLYGYGIKGFTLSMIETALAISDNSVPGETVEKIMDWGRELLERPIELLPGIEQVLTTLKGQFRLVVATKGDLLDQQRKMRNSGIAHFFDHIEIMSNKEHIDYEKLLTHLQIGATEFLMIGNSIKSDVLPVLSIGGHAVHVPYHTTWAHEVEESVIDNPQFRKVNNVLEIMSFLS